MAPAGHDLERFVAAQAPVFDDAIAELRAGRKRSHWMWFVFPQLRGLGRSQMAWRYGIVSIDEARAYLAHPVLGPRLKACCEVLMRLPPCSATQVFGSPDDLKLASSMTLFSEAANMPEDRGLFDRVLAQFCGGERDAATLALLR
ncbi:calpastatin [Rhodoferax koreense]|uniref:Calpastatin n=1 Tax=Rhodoferax koreensis TaxID=1842727 RepID=A0A1P8JPY9_9BURK|nr:DUF1810 domain-containing protein [Rhodoferax koreense]APW35816.1 calpastatin [Rhodoferax koreense]